MAGERVVFGLRVVNVFLQFAAVFTNREAVGSSGQKRDHYYPFFILCVIFLPFFRHY